MLIEIGCGVRIRLLNKRFWIIEYIMYLLYLNLGKTILMYAAEYRNTDIVRILIEHGPDVNTKDKDG